MVGRNRYRLSHLERSLFLVVLDLLRAEGHLGRVQPKGFPVHLKMELRVLLGPADHGDRRPALPLVCRGKHVLAPLTPKDWRIHDDERLRAAA